MDNDDWNTLCVVLVIIVSITLVLGLTMTYNQLYPNCPTQESRITETTNDLKWLQDNDIPTATIKAELSEMKYNYTRNCL